MIGSGTMGNGIAHVFASNGWEVTLIDIAQAQLDKAIARSRAVAAAFLIASLSERYSILLVNPT